MNQSKTLIRVRAEIEARWRDCFERADDADDEGAHVGVAMYYHNVARGLGEALSIIDKAAGPEGSSDAAKH